MKKRNLYFYSIAFLLIGAATFLAFNKNLFKKKEATYDSIEMVAHAAALVKEKYVDEVSPDKVFEGALLKMGESLDFLSSYLNREESEKLNDINSMGYSGVKFIKQYGFPIVTNVLKTLDKEVKKGDIIKIINGKSTFNLPYTVVKWMLVDNPGKVQKVVLMRGEERKRIKINLKILPLKYRIVEKGEWTIVRPLFLNDDKVISNLISKIKGKEKVLLDLRYLYYIPNHSVFKFVKYFIKKPVTVKFELNGGPKSILIKPIKFLNFKKLIVINDYQTIEEAEIFSYIAKKAGTLIVGEKTPGECGLMYPIDFKDGTKFIVLSGIIKELYKKGVKPDILIKNEKIDEFLINPEKFLNGKKKKEKK